MSDFAVGDAWPPEGAVSWTSAPGSTRGLVRLCNAHGSPFTGCVVCNPPPKPWWRRWQRQPALGADTPEGTK